VSALAVKTAGSAVSATAGYTNICSGRSAWTAGESRKSTRRRASARCFVPARIPANSTWRKHDPVMVPIGDRVIGGSAYTTAAAGLVAYDTTSGLSPPAPPPLNSS